MKSESKELLKEITKFTSTNKKLESIKSMILKEELPFSMSDEHSDQILKAIKMITEFNNECAMALDSMVDDFENEEE